MSERDLFPRIFISYRREDASGWAGRVADQLILKFGKSNVFFDVDTIEPGSNFVRALNDRTANCDVLLAVIGKEWLTVQDEQGALRLENPQDFVRAEIAAALRREIRIIPILVSGARMPAADELPADLQALSQREAVEASDTGFHATMERLMPVLIREGERRRRAVAAPQPLAPSRELSPEAFCRIVSQEAQRLAGWFNGHRLVAAALFVLALLTFSPIWYRPVRTVKRARPPQLVAPQPVDPQPVAVSPVKLAPVSTAPDSGPDATLRDFKSVYIITHTPQFFNADDLKRELQNNPDFTSLKAEIVDDPAAADILLEVTHNFPGDFPFAVKVRKTGEVLISSEGTGPLGSQAAAATVVSEFVKALKPYRTSL